MCAQAAVAQRYLGESAGLDWSIGAQRLLHMLSIDNTLSLIAMRSPIDPALFTHLAASRPFGVRSQQRIAYGAFQ